MSGADGSHPTPRNSGSTCPEPPGRPSTGPAARRPTWRSPSSACRWSRRCCSPPRSRFGWNRSGSVLYRQRRVGKDGRIFELYKLRTMRQGADPVGSRHGGDGRRSPGDPGRQVSPPFLARRAPQPVQRPSRRDADRRAAGDPPRPGRALHAPSAPSARPAPRRDRLGPDPRPRRDPLGGADRARRLVRRAPFAAGWT